MSQYRAVEEKVPTGINRVPHSWAVSSGWVDPQPDPLGRAEEFIWILCPDNSQSFVFICKCWMSVRLGGIPPPSGRARERSRKFNMDAIIMTHMCSQEAYFLHISNDSCFLNHASQLRMSTAEVHSEHVCIFMLSHQKCFGCCWKKENFRFVSTFIQFNTVRTWDIECSNW